LDQISLLSSMFTYIHYVHYDLQIEDSIFPQYFPSPPFTVSTSSVQLSHYHNAFEINLYYSDAQFKSRPFIYALQTCNKFNLCVYPLCINLQCLDVSCYLGKSFLFIDLLNIKNRVKNFINAIFVPPLQSRRDINAQCQTFSTWTWHIFYQRFENSVWRYTDNCDRGLFSTCASVK
jgi:hypothetical protein